MYTVRQSIFVNAPQQAVFDFLSNPARVTEWQTACHTANAGGATAMSQGGQIADDRNWLGKSIQSTYEVVEHAPPERIRVRVVDGPVPFEFAWTFESVEGGTRVTGDGPGEWTGPQSEALVARAADHSLNADLAVLRALIEQSAPAAAS
jgi:uncharacterized protein YndB with AHSA1/START domain